MRTGVQEQTLKQVHIKFQGVSPHVPVQFSWDKETITKMSLVSATGHQLNWGCSATQSSGVGVEGGQGVYRATTGSLYLRHRSWLGIDQVKDGELDDCRTDYLYYEALSPYHGPRGAPLLLFHKAWEHVL